jgi:hypothetical protein
VSDIKALWVLSLVLLVIAIGLSAAIHPIVGILLAPEVLVLFCMAAGSTAAVAKHGIQMAMRDRDE